MESFGFWVTRGVKIMWLCHGWDWQPPQLASHIHIGHIQCVWANWYAIHGHTISPLHSYSHPLGSDFGVLGHLWSKNDVIMSLLRLTSPQTASHIHIRHIQVFEHIDMLSIGIWLQPYTVIPTLLGSDFGVLGHLWSQNDVTTSGLMLTATWSCFPPPY